MSGDDKVQLAGDICPPWCSVGNHETDRGPRTLDDAGVWHESTIIDSWLPVDSHGVLIDTEEPIRVLVHGYRHDKPEEDWPDAIRVEGNVNPGCLGGVDLSVPDARRLGLALLKACDLHDGLEPEG